MNMFAELFVPKGSLDDEQRATIGERLIAEVIRPLDRAPSEVIDRGRANAVVVIHEPSAWSAGVHLADPAKPTPYLVRVSLPAGHLTDSLRGELIERVNRTLSTMHGEQDTTVWVHINEIPDGNIGGFGRVMRSEEIVEMVRTGRMA